MVMNTLHVVLHNTPSCEMLIPTRFTPLQQQAYAVRGRPKASTWAALVVVRELVSCVKEGGRGGTAGSQWVKNS